MLKFYRLPALSVNRCKLIRFELGKIAKSYVEKTNGNPVTISTLDTEFCFYISHQQTVDSKDVEKLKWILKNPFNPENLSGNSFFQDRQDVTVIEIGARLNYSSPFSTNAVSICRSIGLTQIDRIEVSIRYCFQTDRKLPLALENLFVEHLHDKMTQCRYVKPIENFHLDVISRPWYEVDLLKEGRKALENVNLQLGLAMDDWDIDYYTAMFLDRLKRNPTSVECFDLAQSNSEHSRHWFFKGDLIINGKRESNSLFDLIMSTQYHSNANNVIKFSDNSSAIEGYTIGTLLPSAPWTNSKFCREDALRHLIYTAETHNFPTAVSPFSGAATGTGGRIRDVQAAGRGAHVIAGIAGYCFGNVHLPDLTFPWEQIVDYPSNFAHPREVIIEASNGASDYGNKFGEPVIAGFARSCGILVDDGERREWIKPIMFSGGIGSIDGTQCKKLSPVTGMEVVKLGGPIYRIGVGGGAASSVQIQGDSAEDLDFGAVQRGDAEMEQKLNRVIRACVEMKEKNPICSIHDQGAGGNGNVLKEIVEPEGAIIHSDAFQKGDPTINILELWGAEYQESNAILVNSNDKEILEAICSRERCPVSFVGKISGDRKITLVESNSTAACHPVDLELDLVLGKMPKKVFNLETVQYIHKSLEIPATLSCPEALRLVLSLPSVASKRYLTNKVDRCVTGLIAQQQCVGPLHTPLADVAVIALSYFNTVGGAVAVGEQPIKGLIDPAIGARMSVAEAITNLMFAHISSLQDVKCSANWMWAAKLPGEGVALHVACVAMINAMKSLGIAVDGGKDSLSMAARVGNDTIKAPGTVVISAYAPCPDITATVTPDFKCVNGSGCILLIQLYPNESRLGGTALAQVLGKIGNVAPDLDDPDQLRRAFAVTQELLRENKITSGHDISDGGFITCLLEMAFAGNCGLDINISVNNNVDPIAALFTEEIGWILEVEEDVAADVIRAYTSSGISCVSIGKSKNQNELDTEIVIKVNNVECIRDKMVALRLAWEETSCHLELRQTNNECVEQEKVALGECSSPPYFCSYLDAPIVTNPKAVSPRMAIIREEGTNGDREMTAAFFEVGFEVWDITMTDLLSKRVTLDRFQGLVFPGGFSYADVLGSGKGWASAMQYNQDVREQLKLFRNCPTTFSFGVCNGCQLMAHLGWISPINSTNRENPDFRAQGVNLIQNVSERFECRFSTVRIEKSPAIMLQNMDGAVLGVWVAHGEGKFDFKNDKVKTDLISDHLAPIRFVDHTGEPTTRYPFNPNGSSNGIAAICSKDGRHLAVMPHPERCVYPWQWAWMPANWRKSMVKSPWLRMFENAYHWCSQREHL